MSQPAGDVDAAIHPAAIPAPEPSSETTASSLVPPHAPASSVAPPGHKAERLWLTVLLLALPVVVEQWLHSVVGLTDTYLANHLVMTRDLTGPALEAAHNTNRAAAAAVGSVMYFLWFVGLLASSVGVGATALISRATGARHRSLANAVVGQTLLAAAIIGAIFGALLAVSAPSIAPFTGLDASAQPYFVGYLRVIGPCVSMALVMMASASCLRGGGDTLSPALAVMVVDVVNAAVSYSLVRGLFGLPQMGLTGIAIGTTSAYIVGAVMQVALLLRRRSKVRLFRHRLAPNLAVLHRIFRIGLPSGVESLLIWGANFGVLFVVNRISNAAAAAHMNTIRIESFSFMTGMGFAVAASTLVGQSLGQKNPERARRCAHMAFAWGGGAMIAWGIAFIVLGDLIARAIAEDPEIVSLTGRCLWITGFIQIGFAAALIFSGALRGAGDTLHVMIINLISIVGIRLTLTIIVGRVFNLDLAAVWYVLCGELLLRGLFLAARFELGKWHLKKV